VEKCVDALPEEGLSLGDRKNMAYKGTFVTYGRGMGLVAAIGMATEFGKIATMLQDEEEVKTPLQKRLTVFGRKLALAVLAIRSEKQSLFTIGLFPNTYLLGAIALTFLLQMATIYVPLLNPIVKTVPLTLGELLFCIAWSALVFVAVEIEKAIKRRRS
jgi:Ca2+-transporting ATPase